MARIAYLGLAGTECGGTRILAEHLNRLTDLGHECELLLLHPVPINWMPVKFNQSHFTESSRFQYDAVVATEINTWPIVADYSAFPNADRRFVFIQMVEHLFFGPGSDEWNKYKGYADYLWTLRPIVISEWLYQWASNHSPFTPTIIPNGVNREMFYPQPFDVPKKKKLRILIEGHGENKAKDIVGMSHRAATFLRSKTDFELWGFSQYPQPFEFDNYWRLPSQEEIRAIYSSCDIILKASRFEGRSCVDPEAFACGCVVNRAIDLGDDDLIHGFNCLKARYGDQTDFNSNMMRLVENNGLRDELRGNAIEYIDRFLSWEKIAQDLEDALLDHDDCDA